MLVELFNKIMYLETINELSIVGYEFEIEDGKISNIVVPGVE